MTASRQLSPQQTSLLITALMAHGIGQSLVFAILAPLGREVQLAEVQITSIIAISAIVFGLIAPRWGRLSDRVGRKPIMITGLVGYSLGTLLFTSTFYAGLTGLLTGGLLYGLLLISRCTQSLVMSGTSPSATAYAADHSSPDQRTRAMARLGTANSLGTILGPAVSGALATFGLLAPLYFAAALTASVALLIWWQLPTTPAAERGRHVVRARLRYRDTRLRLYLVTGVGLYMGFSGIQQTLGFHLQDRMELTGIETAQMTGAVLMVAAVFTFLVQVTAMQRLKLRPPQFMRLGLLAMLFGAAILAGAQQLPMIAAGMAFLGTGMGLAVPAVSAGASLAVGVEEQGAAAGLITACPAIGFSTGPVCAGFLYQINDALAPLFSAAVFFLVLVFLVVKDR